MSRKNRLMDAFTVLFLAVFAMPFYGGYMMLGEERENKVLGAILLTVGIVIWLLFGLH